MKTGSLPGAICMHASLLGTAAVAIPLLAASGYRAAAQAVIRFEAAERSHLVLEVPKGWENVPVQGNKPMKARITARFYRTRLLQGYTTDNAVNLAPTPRESRLGDPTQVPEGDVTKLSKRLREIATDSIENLRTSVGDRTRTVRVERDTQWNAVAAARAVKAGAAGLFRKAFQQPPDNVQLVDPANPKGKPLSATEKNLAKYAVWRVLKYDAVPRSSADAAMRTALFEVTVEWTFEVTFAPGDTSRLEFLNFTAAPASPNEKAGQGGEAAPEEESDPKPTPGDTPPSDPVAVTALAGALGILPAQLISAGRQPGVELVGGAAIKENAPDAMLGLMAHFGRPPAQDNGILRPLRLSFDNLGVLLGRTIGSRGSWVIAPSLRIGANGWAYLGGAYSDSHGTTRSGLVGGIGFRFSDVLGGGPQTQEQSASNSASVQPVSDPYAKTGPLGRVMTDAVTSVKTEGLPAPPTGVEYWLEVMEDKDGQNANLPLGKPDESEFYAVFAGTVKEVRLWLGKPYRKDSQLLGSSSEMGEYSITTDPPIPKEGVKLDTEKPFKIAVKKN